MLTLQRAIELNNTAVTEEHLILHAKNVCYAMGAMAEHFGEDPEYWQAIGMLHDYDYEQYPEEHLSIPRNPCWRRASIRKTCGRSFPTATASAAT